MASVASMASIAYRNSFAPQSFRKRKWQHLLPLRLLFFFFFKKKAISFCCYSKFSYLCTRFFKITQINTNITRNNGDIH